MVIASRLVCRLGAAVSVCLLTGSATIISAAETGPASFEGVWMPTHVSLQDPRWRIEDLACGGMCSLKQFEYLQALLRNPDNDDTPIRELLDRSQKVHRDYIRDLLTPLAIDQLSHYVAEEGAAVDCDPNGDGITTQITAPLLSRIERYDDRIVIRYEYWNAVRTVYMDGRPHPADITPSRLGHSIGWFEGATLVVDTSGLTPGELYVPAEDALKALTLSDGARLRERYTLAANGQRLDLVWSISDPVYLREVVQGQKSALLSPGWTLDEFVCESITGKF